MKCNAFLSPRRAFLLSLVATTFFSLRIAAMNGGGKFFTKSSGHSSTLTVPEATARNRRLYDRKEADGSSFQEHDNSQEEETADGFTNFDGEARALENPSESLKAFSDSSSRPAIVMEEGYLFPQEGGCFYNGLQYTEHALERMAPSTPEVIKLLMSHAFQKMPIQGRKIKNSLIENKNINSVEAANWWQEFCPDPRAILPTDVEAEISNPGSTDLNVIMDETGRLVITVFRKSNSFKNKLSDVINNPINKRIKEKARQIESQLALTREKCFAGDNNLEESVTFEILTFSNPKAKPDDDQLEKMIQRRSRFLQDRAVALDEVSKSCTAAIEAKKKANKNKTVDIAAWKAAQKTKKSQQSFETVAPSALAQKNIRAAKLIPNEIPKIKEDPQPAEISNAPSDLSDGNEDDNNSVVASWED